MHYKEIQLGVGTHLVCGDVHGYFTELDSFVKRNNLEDANFYFLGDLFNRGKENLEVFNFVKSNPKCHAIAGNHELLIADFFAGKVEINRFIRNGGYWFTQLDESVKVEIVEFINSLPLAIKLTTPGGKTRGLVHACCGAKTWEELRETLTTSENPRSTRVAIESVSDRVKFNRGEERVIPDIDWIFVGHNPVERIGCLGNTMYLDCGLYLGGSLRMVNLLTLKEM